MTLKGFRVILIVRGAGCFNCKAANVACYMKLRLNDGILTLKGLLV